MNLEIFENVIMLMAAILGLLSALFRYIEFRKPGWLYVAGYFLANLLSAYYWTTYSFVMGDYPEVSAFVAYFGWNVGYIILLIAVLKLRPMGMGKYINPLMFLPVPLNVLQFFIYIQYGGFLNNLYTLIIVTAIACISLNVILYWFKNRKSGAHFPYFHTVVLIYIAAEYGMWTSSCYAWPSDLLNPYYYSAYISYIVLVLFAWAVGKDYEAEGFEHPEKNSTEMRLQVILQAIVSIIILGGCFGGYYLAGLLKGIMPAGSGEEQVNKAIASTLFVVSVMLDIIILFVVYIITYRYKNLAKKAPAAKKRSRFNFVFTLLVTLALMIFVVAYTSRLFYRVSVNSLFGSGEDKAASTATELENYLVIAQSTLGVVADSVDLMIKGGESQEVICEYLVDQTKNQQQHLDENFTGFYGYVRGEYMDGLEWVPPEGYEPTERDWYKEALKGEGKTIICSPYLDAQTGSMVITICRLLSDGKDVVALDVIVDHIQDITDQIDINGKGYGMIVNSDDLIVAYPGREYNGERFSDVFGGDLLDSVIKTERGTLDTVVRGEDSTVFVSLVMKQWYVVIVVSDDELFKEMYDQMSVSIVVFLIIYALISFFYYLGYKNEQAYGKKVEEMKVGRQKQEYEAQVLKLEKLSADEANRAKSSFLADMSHEIRTPINAILGMNEMILREAKDKDIREYGRNIQVSGNNLLQLVNSILDFSKIEDGKMEIVPVRYSTSALITYLVNSISERADAKGLNFKTDIDPKLPKELYGDDTRINQVIMNLLTNAVKYTHEGSVTLTMQAREKKKGRVKLFVDVTDTGIGIKESDMDKLFESFERLDVVRNRNIEGTGLGMAIVTKLLALMNSELKVRSEYGLGSSFSFELWQKIEDDTELGEYTPGFDKKDDPGSYRESFTAPDAHVLIVDDTKVNLTVAINLLKKTGVKIDTALSGDEAIGLAKQNDYDVILMDQRMPGMDGTQTLKEIRALENKRNHDTPVICLTADAIRGAREKYMEEGFSDYLTKPIDGALLERMLLTYLPEDKVTLTGAEDMTAAEDESLPVKETTDDPLFAALKAEGVDTDKGLAYSQKDKELYRTVLTDYAAGAAERILLLKEHYDSKNWDDYGIYVHALKSTSAMIGANDLSAIAAGLEKAAGDKDVTVINRDHEKAMEMYDSLVAVIKGFVQTDDDKDAKASVSDSGYEVLEFMPADENDDGTH
ncbi:MAG: response regulator [Lachnospiraceae bacterium]|nr:response regulator [Lachnospiraceae bacterium]